MTKIKYKLSALRTEKTHLGAFRGDYVLNKNLCVRYNELVFQLKLLLDLINEGRSLEYIKESLDNISDSHIRKAKEFDERLKQIANERGYKDE